MSIQLNTKEEIVYDKIIFNVVPYLKPGIYYAKDLFGSEPTNPRITRKIYEEVACRHVTRMALVGTKSSQGYLIL